MKIGKTFHFIASIISFMSILTMLLPIASISGAVNMIQSALGIECRLTWSSTVIFAGQIFLMIIAIFPFISKFIHYSNYSKIKFLRVIQISISSLLTLLSFLTLAIIGVPSSAGISIGPGPIMYSISNLVVITFLILSFIYVSKKEETKVVMENAKSHDEEIKNIDLLLKYKELLDKEIISKEEYETKKKELLK